MHDLDRSFYEMGEHEAHETHETHELEHEDFLGVLGSLLGGETGHEFHESGELHETHEMELASELLEVTNEDELEHFIGSLLSRAAGAAGQFVRSPTGKALGGLLKQAARKTLPTVGRALGDMVAPGVGGDVGAQVARAAANIFGLELEGLSQEDKEFELARSFIRLADAACRHAASAPPSAPPAAVAKAALATAARRYAPGLAEGLAGGVAGKRAAAAGAIGAQARRGTSSSGRWVRRGRTIVVYL